MELLEDRRLLAGTPELLANVNTREYGPNEIVQVGSSSEHVYIVVDGPQYGRELWVTDGTVGGENLLVDIVPGGQPSNPTLVGSVDNLIYFIAETPEVGRELWVTDGTTPGTRMLPEFVAGQDGIQVREATAHDGELFFVESSQFPVQLWKTDGTNTQQIVAPNDIRHLMSVGDQLFFQGETREHGAELWTTDGTTDGTRLVRELFPGPGGSAGPRVFAEFQGRLLMGVSDHGRDSIHQLWVTDGTESGTELLFDFGDLEEGPTEITVANNAAYFFVTSVDGRVDLWRTDGTAAGTAAVLEVQPAHTGEDRMRLTAIGEQIFFVAGEGGQSGLWASDGTADGTRQLTSEATGGPTQIDRIHVADNKAYFAGHTVEHSKEVWVSDGTVAGTHQVRDVGLGSVRVEHLTPFQNRLAFVVAGLAGRELYLTDGTSDGTIPVTNINSQDDDSAPTLLTAVGDKIFYRARDAEFGFELFVTDLTAGETTRLTDLSPGPGSERFGSLTTVADTLYFVPRGRAGLGAELWRSDGTTEGTHIVRDINVGSSGSNPRFLVPFDERLLFATDVGLYVTDGTAQNTLLLTEAEPVNGITVVGNNAFFAADAPDDDPNVGVELWVTDGTAAGTRLLKDIAPGSRESFIEGLVDVNGTLVFRANDGETGNELWRSDGTPEGTVLLKDIRADAGSSAPTWIRSVGNVAYFIARDETHGRELWRSDGTSAGTQLVVDLLPGVESLSYGDLMTANDKLFFRYDDRVWVSDGTAEGTESLTTSSPVDMTVSNGVLFFTAHDPRRGNQIWMSDGTPEGTTVIDKANAGVLYTDPSLPLFVGETVVFAASNDRIGRELWGVHLDADAQEPLELERNTVASHLYSAEFSGRLTTDEPIHTEIIELRGNQRVSISVDPRTRLRPRVSVLDAVGTVLASAESSDGGLPAVINGFLLPGDGTYQLRADSVDASTGRFDAIVQVNSVFELESVLRGVDNSTQATAQSLDEAFIPITTGVAQAAVFGNAGDADLFSLSLGANEFTTFAVTASSDQLNIELLDASQTLQAKFDVPAHSTEVLQEFFNADAGTYYLRISNPEDVDYSVVILRGAALDEDGDTSIETANSFALTGRIVGEVPSQDSADLVSTRTPVRLRDGDNQNWRIGLRSIERSSTFRDAFALPSFPLETPRMALEDDGREAVVLPYVDREGLVTTRKWFVSESEGFVRLLDTITNTATQPLIATFQSNIVFSRDQNELFVAAQQNEDGSADINDKWMVFDDDVLSRGEAALVVWGQPDQPGGLTFFQEDFDRDRIEAHAAIEIQPGETISQMYFIARSNSREELIERAESLSELTIGDALSGLSRVERETVINWNLPSGNFFEVAANADDDVTVLIETPESGTIDDTNDLAPTLALVDSTGEVLVAAGSTDNQVSHHVATADSLFVSVKGGSSFGSYVILVDGANGAGASNVMTSRPQDGAVIAETPSSIQIELDEFVRIPSVQAADLTINGQPADSFNILDGKTLQFGTNSELDGDVTISVAPESIVDVRGQFINPFTATFEVDGSPAVVTSTSVVSNEVLPTGRQTIRVQFNKPVHGEQLTENDVRLTRGDSAVTAIDAMSYDAATNTLSLTADLQEHAYRLTLFGTATGYSTLAGVPMDGDRDGQPGGDFVLTFSTDTDTLAIGDLRSTDIAAAGVSLGASSMRILGAPDDVDAFQFTVPPRTLVDILVRAEGFHPAVQLRDSETQEVVAELPSTDGVSQTTLPFFNDRDTAHSVLVEVSGDGIGSYDVDVAQNANFESEALGSNANDSIETAQPLDPARVAVDADVRVWQANAIGNSSDGDVDLFSYDYLPDTTYSIAASGIHSGAIESLRVLNVAGEVLFLGEQGTNLDRHITASWAPLGSETLYLEVIGDGEYQLTIRENAAFELAADADTSQRLDLPIGLLGEISKPNVLYLIEERDQNGLYVVEGTTGRWANVGTSLTVEPIVGLAPGASSGELFVQNYHHFFRLDASGNGVIGDRTRQDNLITGLAFDDASGVLYGGTATRQFVELNPTTGSTVRELAQPLGEIIGLAFGEGKVFAVHQSNTLLTTYDPTTNAWVEVGDTGSVWAGLAYDDVTRQLFAVRSDAGLYTINPVDASVTQVAQLEIQLPNGQFTRIAGNGGLAVVSGASDPTGNSFFTASPSDRYEFRTRSSESGMRVVVDPLDTLKATVALMDSAGGVIGTASSDAPGDLVALDVPTNDGLTQYSVQVSGLEESSGRYLLRFEGDTQTLVADSTEVSSVTPDLGTVLAAPESLTFHFTNSVLGTSVGPESLTVEGVAATRAEFTGSRTVQFTLPKLLPGQYEFELNDELVDSHGRGIAGWADSVLVEPEILGPPAAWLSRAASDGEVTEAEPETFLANVEVPQQATLRVIPSASLAPQVRMLSPTGNVVADFASGTGQVTMNAVELKDSGLYTIEVHGADDTRGAFDVALIYGGVVETEPNDTTASAISLDEHLDASGLAQRVNVLGEGDGTAVSRIARRDFEGEVVRTHTFQFDDLPRSAIGRAEIRIEARGVSSIEYRLDFEDVLSLDFEYFETDRERSRGGVYFLQVDESSLNALLNDGSLSVTLTNPRGGILDSETEFVQMSIEFSTLGDTYDAYSFSLDPGETFTAAVDDAGAEVHIPPLSIENFLLAIQSGEEPTVVKTAALGGPSATISIFDDAGDLVAEGQPFSEFDEVVEFSSATGGSFTMQVHAIDEYALVATKSVTLDVEPNHRGAEAQPLGVTGRATGGISETGTLYHLFEDKIYALGQGDTGWQLVREGLDRSDINQFVRRVETDPRTGLRYSESRNNVAAIDIRTNREFDLLPPSPIQPRDFAFAHDRLYVVGDSRELVSSTAVGYFDYEDREWTVVGTAADIDGSYQIEYDPIADVLYAFGSQETNLYQLDPHTLERTVIGSLPFTRGVDLLFVPGEVDPTGALPSMLEPGDRYQLSAKPGDVLVIETQTPLIPGNNIDPQLHLFNAAGESLAFDASSSADGRNARMVYNVAEPGELQVVVSSENGEPGAYSLTVGGTLSGVELAVESVTPARGAQLEQVPNSMTFQFTDQLDVSTVQASDLQINGVSATDLTIVDGRSLRFDLPPLLSGFHHWSLDDELMASTFGQPLVGTASGFYVPTANLGLSMGQAHELNGEFAVTADEVLEIPIPLDDDQTFGVLVDAHDFVLAEVDSDVVNIEFVDPRGQVLSQAQIKPDENVVLPILEIAQSGTHLLRLTGQLGSGSLSVRGLLNASLEQEDRTDSRNDTFETAEIVRSRNLNDDGAKLGVLLGELPFHSTTMRRGDGIHGGSSVFTQLELSEEPQGDGLVQVFATGDMHGEDRFVTVQIEGVAEPVQFFKLDGVEGENVGRLTLPASLMTQIYNDDRLIDVMITPSLAIGNAVDDSLGVRVDYPLRRFEETLRVEDGAVAGRVSNATFSIPDRAFAPGTLVVRSNGDFSGPEKSLSLRLSERTLTLFADDTQPIGGIYTSVIQLEEQDVDGPLGIRLEPSAEVGEVTGNYVELEADVPVRRWGDSGGFNSSLSTLSPTTFHVPVSTPIVGDGVLRVRQTGILFNEGDSLQLNAEDLITTRVFGSDTRRDIAYREAEIPIPFETLQQLSEDGVVDLTFHIEGGLLFADSIEVQLDYVADQDLYRFQLHESQQLDVGVQVDSFRDVVSIEVLNAAGQVLSVGQSDQLFAERVQFSPGETGEFFVRVTGRADTYTLTVGLDVLLESEGSTEPQELTSDIVVGAARGLGGLITSEDRNARIRIINSETGEVSTQQHEPDFAAQLLLSPSSRSDQLYQGVDDDNGWLYRGENNVVVMDLATGRPVKIVEDVSPEFLGEVAFGGGALFGVAHTSSLLYRFNEDSERWSVVGDTGIVWDSSAGLAYDDANNTLYALVRGKSRLLQIDPRTAAVTEREITGLVNGGRLAYFDAEIGETLSPEYVRSGDQSDRYEFAATLGDSVSVTMHSLGAGPLAPNTGQLRLDLLSPTGEVVGSSSGVAPSVEVVVQQSGSHEIVITPLDGAPRPYQLEVDGRSSDSSTSLAPLFPGVGVSTATLEADVTGDPIEYRLEIGGNEPFSIVRFAMEDEETPALTVFGPSGVELGTMPSAGPGEHTVLQLQTATPGSYIVRTTGAGKLRASVFVGANIEAEFVLPNAGNDDRSTAQSIDFVPQTSGGSIATVVGGSEDEAAPNLDYYRFDVVMGETLDFAVATHRPTEALTLLLENENGQVIATGNDVTSGTFSQAISQHTASSDGPLFVRVEAKSTYALLVTRDIVLNTGSGATSIIAGLSRAIGSNNPTGVLYFAADRGVGGGLWVVDTASGETFAAGNTGETDNPGLAPFSTDAILGSFDRQIGKYQLDQSGIQVLPASHDATGLAYDRENDRLYGTGVGSDQFDLLDSQTGAVVRELADTPPDVSGLAFGNGGVYGLGGDTRLFFYSPEDDRWTVVGETGMGWSNSGLAYNPFTNQLYGKRTTDRMLYSINPETADVTPIGDTGIYWGGGLAFVRDIADPTGNGITFTQPNVFSVDLNAIEYEFTTIAAAAATDDPGLDPRIEIYDGDGKLLASDEDGAADGINAQLRFTPSEDGVFLVHVVGENRSVGTFELVYSPVSAVLDERPVAEVTSFKLDGSSRFDNQLETFSIDFSENVSIPPAALEIRDSLGNPVDTSSVVVESTGNRVIFDLSKVELAPGQYRSLLDGSQVTDSAGQSMLSDLLIGPITVAIQGDANLDGRVDFEDFVIVSNGFGKTNVGWTEGDFDGSGGVDFSDFIQLANHFGQSLSVPIESIPGDTNLDGRVEFVDFILLALNFGNPGSRWIEGDFNGDESIDFADFISLTSNFGGTIASDVSSAFSEGRDWWTP